MFPHPLVQNLDDKTLEELTETISSLNKKLSYVGRMHNHAMMNQILMVLECYKTEYKKRQDEMWSKKSTDLKDKININ